MFDESVVKLRVAGARGAVKVTWARSSGGQQGGLGDVGGGDEGGTRGNSQETRKGEQVMGCARACGRDVPRGRYESHDKDAHTRARACARAHTTAAAAEIAAAAATITTTTTTSNTTNSNNNAL